VIETWSRSIAAFVLVACAMADIVVQRSVIHSAPVRRETINTALFPGSMMAREPERSGSPWSYERWTAVGARGRRFLSGGPRARDITQVLEFTRARQPLRSCAGLMSGRTARRQRRRRLVEMSSTRAATPTP